MFFVVDPYNERIVASNIQYLRVTCRKRVTGNTKTRVDSNDGYIEMKRLLCTVLLGSLVSVALPGCGDAGPTDVTENATLSDKEAYKAKVAAEQAKMDGNIDSKK